MEKWAIDIIYMPTQDGKNWRVFRNNAIMKKAPPLDFIGVIPFCQFQIP